MKVRVQVMLRRVEHIRPPHHLYTHFHPYKPRSERPLLVTAPK